MSNPTNQLINTAGPVILIVVIFAIAVFAFVRSRLATTPDKRRWWSLRAAAVFALALFVALNQYLLHLHWPG
jgi:phosphoglycerol transferase MdoB-like AlkP superfamily enzyme